MGLLPDYKINRLIMDGLILDGIAAQVREVPSEDLLMPGLKKVISFGTTSYGYDARLSPKFKMFSPYREDGQLTVVDPKQPDDRNFVDIETEVLIIPPHSYVLGCTVEAFHIPKDVLVICVGKSTYARCGLSVNVTPLEPGWYGQVTLELFNHLPMPMKVYANEGVCQFLFMRGEAPCDVTYADRAGKYQGQKGVVTARL